VETTLYLVRHGEAADVDHLDPPLTDLGRAQARAVGARLSGIHFNDVLHSSRRRARETAAIMSDSIVGCVPRDSIHAADRTPVPTDQSGLSARLRAFMAGVPEDERDADGRALDQSIDALRGVHDADRHVLVVTHNFVIGWFVRDALDAPPITWTRLNSANGALTILRYRSGEPPRLIAFNDTGHLGNQ
jgi:serine/threonine-protein phosphatase PGAM5